MAGRPSQEMTVSPALQALHPVLHPDGDAGQHQHREAGRLRPLFEEPADLQAAEVGQVDVEEHQVGAALGQRQGLHAVGRLQDGVTLGLQHPPGQGPDPVLVLD